MFVSRTRYAVGAGLDKDSEDQGMDNEDDLNDRIETLGSLGLRNGSFERVSSGDPVALTIANGGTGSYAIDEDAADVRHGRRSLALTTAAVNDTVQVDWDDYTPCSPGERIAASWESKFTDATLTLKVEILWYYYDGAAFQSATTASETLYDLSAANPTSWATRRAQAVAPSGANPARYYRLRFTFGKTGAATTGTLHLDGVSSRVFHGFVSLSRAAKSSGTIDISSNVVAGETPDRAQFGVYLLGGRNSGTSTRTTMSSSGNGKTGMSAGALGADFEGGEEYLTLELDLNLSLQCSISVSLAAYGSSPSSTPDYDIWLLGYYV